MNATTPRTADSSADGFVPSALSAPLAAGLVSWLLMSLGFFGLKILMQERPEFVGQPVRTTKAELVQESPQVVVRKVGDDVSVIKAGQPDSSDVVFEMQGRRDYRGLRTIMDMSGVFRASFVLTNSFEEPIFVLFKCPHPRAQNSDDQSLLAGELKLQSSVPGEVESSKNAWFWTGMLAPHASADIQISYHVASLKGVTYRVTDKNRSQIKHLRVSLKQKDIATLRLESSDGARMSNDASFVWERNDFLAPDFFSAQIGESRSLHTSLSHLLQIGPLICLLFLLAASAVIVVRQKLTAVQMFTIAAGYALYFPLMLYLSANFSFKWALIIAFVVPGILLANYARWLLGSMLGLVGGFVFLLLYQVFPTLAAFAGWNRGMVLLCLGVVTLAVLINLQNRALKRKAASLLLFLSCFSVTNGTAADVQVTLPAEIVTRLSEPKRQTTNSLVSFGPAQYNVRQERTFFQVEAQIPLQVLRVGDTVIPLFGVPVHLQKVQIEPAEMDFTQLVTLTNGVGLFVKQTGSGTLRLSYRAAAAMREGNQRAQIPLAIGPSGTVALESHRNDLEILTGNLWSQSSSNKVTSYDIGVAGPESLQVEWRGEGVATSGPSAQSPDKAREFYGIGITRAQHLTVINSDGSCTHFAEIELPAFQPEEFRMKLPARARLISLSVNGTEINPPVEDQLCRVRLPAREGQQTAHRLSFRIACPAVQLGFIGALDLTLPEVFQTAGTLEWVVALPAGFETQVISSGLERQKTSPDLGRFGDYGRILQSHINASLAKDLAPPGAINLSLKYRQTLPGIYEASAN